MKHVIDTIDTITTALMIFALASGSLLIAMYYLRGQYLLMALNIGFLVFVAAVAYQMDIL